MKADEPLVELETDKVTQEVYAPAAGTLGEITAPEGTVVAIGAVIGQIADGAVAAAAPRQAARPPPRRSPLRRRPAAAPAAPRRPPQLAGRRRPLSPAVRKMVAENNVDPAAVAGTGKDGRLTKGDVTAHLAKPAAPQISPAPQPRRRRARAAA